MDDIEAIKQLKARYFRLMDTKDWDGYRQLFTPDVVVDVSNDGAGVFEGVDAFMDMLIPTLTNVVTVHHGHMPEIELTSATTATGVWSMEDYNLWEDGTQNHGYGHYRETYSKAGGRWRIQTMRLSYLRIDRGTWERPTYVAGAGNLSHLHGPNPAGR